MKENTKTNQETQNVTASTKIYIFIAVGFMLLVLPTISLLVDSQFIFIKYVTRIANGSEVYYLLQQELPGAFVHVYVFNVTNGEDFTSGKDQKLKLKEVGPFIYQEFRRNEQFELDEDAGVMRYTPRLWTKFVPEGSVGDPHKINVTVPNSSLLAMASMLSEKAYWTKAAYNFLVRRVQSTALMNLDVHSNLWGYDEPLITLGNSFLPGWITFTKMGILDRLYDQAAIPRFELGITSTDRFRIKSLNGARGLNALGYENPSKRTRCNTLEDTYEGLAYPLGLTAETKLRVYRNVFCRMLDLELVGTRNMDFVPEAFVYRFRNDTFNIGPSTKCLCDKRRCKNGMSDLSACIYDFPMALSYAHFLYADPQLYDRVEGIHPDEKKHGSEIIVDPTIGLALNTRFTLQISVDVQDVHYNSLAKPFSNMVVPLAYFKIIQAEIPEDGKEKISALHFKFFYIIRGVEICTFILGLVILLLVARKIYWSVNFSKKIRYQITEKKKVVNIIHVEEPLLDVKDFGQLKVLEPEN